MKNNRRNRKLTYIKITNIYPGLKELAPQYKRLLIAQAIGSKTHLLLIKMWAEREKLFKAAVDNMAHAFANMAVNTRKVIELHPEFLEDPAIRAGIEKYHPNLLPLQGHPPLNDRAK